MLETIKNLINSKKEFMEAASIIIEDGIGLNMDDSIILGEETEPDVDNITEDPDEMSIGGEEPEIGVGEEDGNEEPEEDIMNQPIGDKPEASTTPVEPEPTPGNDILDTPINAADNETVMNDITSTNIGLQSDTPTDLLPTTPPASAIDSAIGPDAGGNEEPEEDIMNQPIGSAPIGEEGEDIPTPPVTPEPEIPDEPEITEAVILEKSKSIKKKIEDATDYVIGKKPREIDPDLKRRLDNAPTISMDALKAGEDKGKKKKDKSPYEDYDNDGIRLFEKKIEDADDILNIPITESSDSGIGDDIFNTPIMEEISIGGEGEDTTGDDKAADGGSSDKQNDVTSAVIDKVNEQDTPADANFGDEPSTDDLGDTGDTAATGGTDNVNNKIIDKLADLNKVATKLTGDINNITADIAKAKNG